jgi:cytochrome c oxidase cbb3-type subunit 3
VSDESRILDHEYDGIREYDNPLPGWWKAIFAGSIVFAACYGFYFHIANWGTSPDAAYRADLAFYDSQKARRETADAANVSESLLEKNAADEKTLAHGKGIFVTRCAPCHTENGRGLIGPNLTDEFQIHGTMRMDIYKTVHDGAPGTPMQAWGEQLPATDLLSVASFVTTLRGTNIPGKEPQGQRVGKF